MSSKIKSQPVSDRYVVPMPCRECKHCVHGALYCCGKGRNQENAMDKYFFHHKDNGYDIYKSCGDFSQQKFDLIPANDLYDRFMQMKFEF